MDLTPLQALRKLKGLSQSQLARQTGVPLYWIKGFETGKNVRVLQNLIILANFFDVTVDMLLNRSEGE